MLNVYWARLGLADSLADSLENLILGGIRIQYMTNSQNGVTNGFRSREILILHEKCKKQKSKNIES